jgi:hypothetical protein
MSPASEGIQFKDNSLEERINERHKATEGREMGGGMGEPGASCIF